MSMIDPILAEFERECATTKRVLERIPQEKLDWKPHPKSMSLGELSWHIATVPGAISSMALNDSFDIASPRESPPRPSKVSEILMGFAGNIKTAQENLRKIDDKKALETFRLLKAGKEILSLPKIGLIRTILLNHSYHHRGQLSVYIRLLGVPVPSIYGPSADENPFA